MIIALASQGLIPLEAGIAMVLGASIDTTLTALLAAVGQPRSALHAAVGLVAFKVLMVLIWLPLIGPLKAIARALSPSAQGMALTEQLAYEVPRQVANVHLIANLSTVLLLLPFTNQMAALIVRVVGVEPKAEETDALAPALNAVLFEVSPLALYAARREVVRLGERIAEQLEAVMPAILEERHGAFEAAQAKEWLIDAHHAAIVGFVEKRLQPQTPRDVCRTAIDLVEADYLEAIGDVIDKEMIPLCRRHAERATSIGPQAREHLRPLAEPIGGELRRALRAVAEADQPPARAVLDTKSQLGSLERAAVHFQIEPQWADSAQRMLPTAFERELTESLRRLRSLIRRFVRAGTDLQRGSVDKRESS